MAGKLFSKRRARQSGFTIVELVAVIVITAVLAVAAVASFHSGGIQANGYYQAMVNAVRFAREVAVSTGCDVEVTINAGSYAVTVRDTGCKTGNFTVPLRDPVRGGALSGTAPSGITASPASTFFFNDLGEASTTGTSAYSINVSGAGFSKSFTVFVATGYVAAS